MVISTDGTAPLRPSIRAGSKRRHYKFDRNLREIRVFREHEIRPRFRDHPSGIIPDRRVVWISILIDDDGEIRL